MSEKVSDFGFAIKALKEGHFVARKGWNGKGMYLALSSEKNSNFILLPEGAYRKVVSEDPFIIMMTAQQTWQPGWLASQADMLAEDWEIVNE